MLFSLSFSVEVQVKKTDSEFSKTFCGRYLFVVFEYLCNYSPKIRTKHFKNNISILAIANNRNRLDASSPLIVVHAQGRREPNVGPGPAQI